MKGYIGIDIPVKPYIKAYMQKELGEVIKLSTGDDVFSEKLYDVLEHKQNERKTVAKCNYGAKIHIYIGIRTFRVKGINLNNSNVRRFNRFAEKLVKHKFYYLMDHLIEVLPSFEANLPEVRRQLGIDLEAWSDDSMKKDYYRYRLKKKLPILYKTSSPNVPSEPMDGISF